MVRVTKFRRSNGVWYVRYAMGGERAAESARTRSESVAESYRIRREMEINAGIQPVRHGDVGDLIGCYLEAMPPKTSPAHRGEAERILKGFLQICGRKRAEDIYVLKTGQLSPETVDRFIARRPKEQLHDGSKRSKIGRRVSRYKPVSNVTLRKELRYLSGFFNWCCRQRPPYLRENPIPLSNAASLKNDSRPHFMITEEEFRALRLDADKLREASPQRGASPDVSPERFQLPLDELGYSSDFICRQHHRAAPQVGVGPPLNEQQGDQKHEQLPPSRGRARIFMVQQRCHIPLKHDA